MAAVTGRARPLRGPGLAFLVVGIVLLAVGAATRQTAFLTMGPSMVGAGIAFIAAARRRTS